MGIFSDIAFEKMLELSSNTENKVGRELYRSNPQSIKASPAQTVQHLH